MFDYFLRFSAFLAELAGAECEWLQEQLAIVYIVDGVEYPEGELPAGKTEADATWIGCRAYLGWDAYEPDPTDEVGFLYSFADKPDKAGRWFLHLYATQSGNVGNVAYVVQKFLKRFRPADSWFLTYCIGSDRAGVGEFGGGAVFVTASTVESFNASEFVEEKQKQHDLQKDIARLVRKAEDLRVKSEDLDDIVHDTASSLAASIDNAGPDGQIAWLVDQLGIGDTETYITNIAEREA